jgi:hypothetical protein
MARDQNTASSLSDAIDRAISFLVESQLADGAFEIRMSPSLLIDGGAPEHALFPAAFGARALGACGESSDAKRAAERAISLLRKHMEWPGVWRHCTRDHPNFQSLPIDVDDTACIGSVLARHGLSFRRTRNVLLANRRSDGLFYTWVVPHWPPARDVTFWGVAAKRWRHPRSSSAFWSAPSARPEDVDCVVNAHALAFLGPGPWAAPVAAFLKYQIRAGTDTCCDKWYRSSAILHAAVARAAAAGVSDFADIQDEACELLVDRLGPDGGGLKSPAETAFAVLALTDWNASSEARKRACDYLVATQSDDGSWPLEIVYYGGPPTDPGRPEWGSAEFTTAVCLEALVRGIGRTA